MTSAKDKLIITLKIIQAENFGGQETDMVLMQGKFSENRLTNSRNKIVLLFQFYLLDDQIDRRKSMSASKCLPTFPVMEKLINS